MIGKINNYFNMLSIGEALFKSKADIYKKNTELLLMYEEKLELLLIKSFNDSKKDVISKLNILDKYINKKFFSKHLPELIKYPLETKYKFTQVGNTRFKEFTFSVEIRNWLLKSGINDDIDFIVSINSDPFKEALTDSQLKSYVTGGQTVFNIFDLGIDFALRDKNVEKFYENYSIKLSNQVTKELQTKIKYEILEGIKNAESIPKIRNRILNVYDKPIDVVVKPKLNANGDIIRQGYTYQMSPTHWANTTARTEVMNAYTVGRLDGFKLSGVVDKVQYSTSPDERLCEVCAPLDGTIYKLENADGIIPVHPNCRCQWIPLISDDYKEAKEKAQNNIYDVYGIDNSGDLYEYGKGDKHIVDEFIDKIYDRIENPKLTKQEAAEKTKKIMDDFFGKKISLDDFKKAFSINVSGYEVEIDESWLLRELVSIYRDKSKKDFAIRGIIKTSDGKIVGRFVREFEKYDDKKIIHHSFFELEKIAQGKGISKSLLNNSIEFYDYLEFEGIEILADLDVGKYAWSKYGFDFESDSTLINYRYEFLENVEKLITDKLEKMGAEHIEIKIIFDEIRDDIFDKLQDFTHSWDFALFKEKIYWNGLEETITGKELMLNGSSWDGILNLNKDSISRKIFDNYLKRK